MEQSLEYIESYFKGDRSPEQIREFEQRIIEDPVFAEELAFYLSSVQVISNQVKEEKKKRFREIYDQRNTGIRPLRKLWPYLAAAVVAVAIAGVYLWYPAPSLQALADQYISREWRSFSVTLGSREDSLQTGNRLYNDGNLSEALRYYESIIQSHPSDYKAKEYAGIVSLQQKDYDRALNYFIQLENYPGLHANPGKFYHALTLMKRNRPGDAEEAKELLKQVVQQDSEGKEFAQEWLRKL